MKSSRYRRLTLAGSSLFAALLFALPVWSQSAAPFMRRPDIHGDKVVFTSEGDLWLGSVSALTAQRITSHPGVETNAHFSPDGTLLAFTAAYDGNTDVYVMPTVGGEPKRLTYDPSAAIVQGWTPDGKFILFRSRRRERSNQLFKVPVGGGLPELLPIPQGEHASMSGDGQHVAYVPVSAEWQHWFRYQGGEADDIWLADTHAHTFKKLTAWAGVDTTPTWAGKTLYFISEREGLANLFRLDPASGKTTPITHYADYEARYPSSDGQRVVFQHGRGLAVYDPAANKTTELHFVLNSDRIHARPRRVPLLAGLNMAAVGPSGKRIIVDSRGQLMSVPTENGDARPIALLPESRCQRPAWSADGKQIAFVSDKSGEEQIWLCPTVGTDAPKQLTRDHVGPLQTPAWSPDGRHLAVGDNEIRCWLIDATTGAMTLVDQADRGGSYNASLHFYRFSPDGKYLAYVRAEPNWNDCVWLYDIAAGKKTRVTSAEMNSEAPAFDATGKYLLFLSDRQFDPQVTASHFFGYSKTTKVSLVTLAAETPSPFLLNNDEEGTPDTPPAKPTPATATVTKIDIDGIGSRIVDIPLPVGRYTKVEGVEGRLLVQEQLEDGSAAQLIAFDLKKKQPTTVVSRLTDFDVSADHKKILLRNDKEFSVVDASTGPVTPGTGKIEMAALTLQVDPTAEWKQMFAEAWRIGRDFFYDPKMHGVDWQAVKRKYAPHLTDVADRSDLNLILGDMIAELNVGHAYVGGGDLDNNAPRVAMGYLGADLDPVAGKNAFRIAKIFAGDEFDLDARSPLLTPGASVKPGDYLLAVAGQPVRAEQDVQAFLVGTAGQVVTLTVNSQPTMQGAREIRVKPMASERKARYYDWVESRRQYVLAHGGPNLGYVHIPDMEDDGLREFTKHYYANVDKDGIVFDVRDNGGGNISAMLLLQMASKPYSYFKPRYGASWTRADWSFAGYSAALCNEHSGSNAEEFCDAFQRLKLGPVIGTRTWGGEVGSGSGYPLLDGGSLFIPNYGEWVPGGDKSGKSSQWVIEGTGAQPDMPVAQEPAAVLTGSDPQLDRAIAYLKAEIAKRPVARPTPPDFPNKAYPPASARKARPNGVASPRKDT